jgi:hypothetical protein
MVPFQKIPATVEVGGVVVHERERAALERDTLWVGRQTQDKGSEVICFQESRIDHSEEGREHGSIPSVAHHCVSGASSVELGESRNFSHPNMSNVKARTASAALELFASVVQHRTTRLKDVNSMCRYTKCVATELNALDTRLSETWSACVAFDAISKSISVASWLRVKGFVVMLATHCEKVKVFN